MILHGNDVSSSYIGYFIEFFKSKNHSWYIVNLNRAQNSKKFGGFGGSWAPLEAEMSQIGVG